MAEAVMTHTRYQDQRMEEESKSKKYHTVSQAFFILEVLNVCKNRRCSLSRDGQAAHSTLDLSHRLISAATSDSAHVRARTRA